jgi:hypothetical protein
MATGFAEFAQAGEDEPMADQDPTAVGYGRPPRSTRFKPGQSGNPKGRPTGVQSLGVILDKALAARVSVQENGRRRIMTVREVIIRGIVNDAARRDPRAIRLLLGLVDRHAPDAASKAASVPLLSDDEAVIADYLARHAAAKQKETGITEPGQLSEAVTATQAEEGKGKPS